MLSQGKSLACPFFPAIVAKMGSNEQIASALEAWANTKFGAGSTVSGLKRLSGGARFAFFAGAVSFGSRTLVSAVLGLWFLRF